MSSQRAISAGEAENFQKIPELFEKSRKTTPIVETWKNQVKGQILKYNLKTIKDALFGGFLNYYKLSVLTRKALKVDYKCQLEKNCFKKTEHYVHDLRNWDEI